MPADSILEKSIRHAPAAAPMIEEFQPFPWHTPIADIPAGNYWVYPEENKYTPDSSSGYNDIEAAIKRFVESKRYPRITYTRRPRRLTGPPVPILRGQMIGTVDRPSEMRYHKTAMDTGTGTINIKIHATDSEQTADWGQKLNIPYRGQTLGAFALLVFDTLLRKRIRKYLNSTEKQEILERQLGTCSLCGDTLGGDTVYDHVVALHQMTTEQTVSDFQAICGQCSADKTSKEPRAAIGLLRSRFSRRVWKAYVESAPTPSMTYKDEGTIEFDAHSRTESTLHQAVDIIRSRRAALYYATSLPIFTPMDDMLPVDPSLDLPDLIYADKPVNPGSLVDILHLLPYHGPAFYHRCAIEYCLHTKKLTWGDLKWGIKASAHYPGDAVRAALDVMEGAWADVHIKEGDAPHKRSVNNMVGTFGIRGAGVRIKSLLSFDYFSRPLGTVQIMYNAFGVPGLFLFSRVTPVLDSGTYRPLYDLCMCTEHVRLAQAHQAIMSCFEPRYPPVFLNVTVDGIIWTRPRKASTTSKVEELLTSIKFCNLPKLEDHIREILHKPEPKQTRLKTASLYPLCVHEADAPVMRVVTPKENQLLRGTYDVHQVTRSVQIESPTYNWNSLSIDDARRLVKDGSSIFIEGLAGTGKSHLIREELIPSLEAQGKRVVVIAKTHNAAAVAGGDTCDHFAWRNIREGGTSADVIWVDEISMLDVDLLCDLNHASFRNPPIQWILSGDFNQYEPIYNTFRGQGVDKSFEDCELLHALADGNKLTMKECKRSDQVLFDWYASLARGGCRHERTLEENVREAKATFTRDKAIGFIPGTELAPVNFVISHQVRESINAQCNQAEAQGRKDAVKFTVEEFGLSDLDLHQSNPQDAFFWPGQRVIACCSGRRLRNGLVYVIESLDEVSGIVVLKRPDLPEAGRAFDPPLSTRGSQSISGEGTESASDSSSDHSSELATTIELPRLKFFRSVRLTHAVTYASIQGLTIEGLCALHDTSHRHFTAKMLFVAMSRARGANNIIVQ